MISASIITIGDELLIGQVIDTNSSWMAQQLNKAGIRVARRLAIGDSAKEIEAALKEATKYAQVVLITGGLGPTSDDITKPVLCEYFNGKMIVNEEALANVRYLFEEVFKRPITPINIKQAEVPDVCEVIQNKRGTAPGMWFEKDNCIFVSMPGVPYEMQGMMTNTVIKKLSERFELPFIVHQTLLTSGIGESMLAEMLTDFENVLPEHIKLAYLPSYGMVRLRLTSSGKEKQKITSEVAEYFEIMKKAVLQYVVTDVDDTLAEVVGKLLLGKGKTMCTAESCTGGYIAHQITLKAGASKYYKGSIVSYDNSVKEEVLEVDKKIIEEYGAVSEQTVIQMLKGSVEKLKTDYGVAVSGVMGPDGGTIEKPVGTVWIAVGSLRKYETKKIQLRFDRYKNIEITSQNALDFLRKFILAN
ncbi:MAG: competence/damage-inducible protein A [Ginsengibacter sp.]